jgi:hypothetical protein
MGVMNEESSLKDDIAAAFDAAEPNNDGPVIDAPAVNDTPPDSIAPSPIGDKADAEAAQRARDEKGRFAKIGETPPPKEAPPKEGAAAPPQEKPPEAPKPPEQPVSEVPKVKPPASWKPTAREGWDKVPPDIQQEVIRRERETAIALQETAEARRTHEAFKQITSPYQPLFQAEGVDPIQGVGNLLRTTAMLASGPPGTKAQIVAGIIKTYGVDIATLDALLSGHQAPAATQPQAPMRDPRVDDILARFNAAEARKAQVVEQQAMEQLSAVEQQEFFHDVRDEMADILEVASRRGLPMTAMDAYNRAIAIHPEVSRVLEQRRAAANSNGSTQRAMAAASSVKGSPTAAPTAPSGQSLQDDIAAAWDRVAGRK